MNSRVWLACAASLAIACSGAGDAGITTSVKSRLAADDTVKAYQINVDTENGVVTLTGTVATPVEESQAILVARNTDGVTDVVDAIMVRPADDARGTTGSEIREAATDLGITTAVKSKFLIDDHVGGLRIDVDTENGVVTLTGNVKSETERARAVELARGTDGVSDVNDRMTMETKK